MKTSSTETENGYLISVEVRETMPGKWEATAIFQKAPSSPIRRIYRDRQIEEFSSANDAKNVGMAWALELAAHDKVER